MVSNPDPARTGVPVAGGSSKAMSGNTLGVMSVVAWAAGFPAAEILLQTWSPLALITVRFLLAVALLIPIWVLVDGFQRVWTAQWRRGAWVGGLSFGLGAYLLLVAQSLTDPVTVALIASSAPLAATLLEVRARTRKLTGRFAMGLAATLVGGLIATNAIAPAQLGPGAACAVLSVFLFSWGSMVTARDFPELGQVGRSTITLAGGLMLMGLLFIAAHATGFDVMPRAPVDAPQIGSLLLYALASLALSQVMWIASVGRLGVAVASFHLNLAPFYVMLIMLSLGAAWNWAQALGAVVVAFGVVLAQKRRPAKQTEQRWDFGFRRMPSNRRPHADSDR